MKEYDKNNDNYSDSIKILVDKFNKDGLCSFNTDESYKLCSSIFKKIISQEQDNIIWSNKDYGNYIASDIFHAFPEIKNLLHYEILPFVEGVYKSHFKIYYGLIYKSLRKENIATGSQIWHSDGGPGTCINLMVSLSDLNENNGAMEILPWPYSLELFKNEREYINKSTSIEDARSLKAKYYAKRIMEGYKGFVERPCGESGTIIAMKNNTIHRGGFPDQDYSRYVCLFHLYPSVEPTPFDIYKRKGIAKTGSYPKNPAFGF